LKPKTLYICHNCGTQYVKPQGKCNACEAWNTIVEENLPPTLPTATNLSASIFHPVTTIPPSPKPLQDIPDTNIYRIPSPDKELNRTLGGGIVLGSLVLIAGEPGIGKSTLMLQLALKLPAIKVFYVSGEENETQIKMRASRIQMLENNPNCYILNETSVIAIVEHAAHLKCKLMIIDSIQTLYTPYLDSPLGSINQIRATTSVLIQYAKATHTCIFLIGHINKEGSIAGPKVLEHMVDTVLQFEGDKQLTYRILRTLKNRFGAAPELGIYEMQQEGLREIENPAAVLLSQRDTPLSGIATSAFLEGNRSLLVEVQALVSGANYGTPQRSSTGFDGKRLNMLLAVLEKRAGLRLAIHDVFLNIAGGLKVEDPALDLAVCAAIYASYKDYIIPSDYCFAAEIGLGGEVRAVNRIEQRMIEASRLGFKIFFLSKKNYQNIDRSKFKIKIQPIEMITELMAYLSK